MKGKIITFIIGLLLGGIISTGSIYFYTVATNSNGQNMGEPNNMNNNSGNMGQNGQVPPEMPENNNSNAQTS